MRQELTADMRNVAPVGSREWLDRRHGYQEPDWNDVLPVAAQSKAIDRMPIPETMRQFYREIGRRGGLERCRRFTQRNIGKGTRFWQRYGSNPSEVVASPVKASPEVKRHLHDNASSGGLARARKCSPERRKAIAAMGGRAKAKKAAKLKEASSMAQAVAGKQPE